jgi:hypothetical protein
MTDEPADRINPPSFVCPKCEAVSYNANDMAHRYCVKCHQFFDEDGNVSTAP